MILQLNPPLPINCPKGEGVCHFLIDRGPEHNLEWVIFITATGECWTFENPAIRAVKNITMGRVMDKDTIKKAPSYGEPIPCSKGNLPMYQDNLPREMLTGTAVLNRGSYNTGPQFISLTEAKVANVC